MSDRMERIREFAEEQRQFDIEEGRRIERERIIELINARTYDSETGQCLSWISDTSNVEKAELIAVINGEEF